MFEYLIGLNNFAYISDIQYLLQLYRRRSGSPEQTGRRPTWTGCTFCCCRTGWCCRLLNHSMCWPVENWGSHHSYGCIYIIFISISICKFVRNSYKFILYKNKSNTQSTFHTWYLDFVFIPGTLVCTRSLTLWWDDFEIVTFVLTYVFFYISDSMLHCLILDIRA